MGITQAAISRMEQPHDLLQSTLKAAASARRARAFLLEPSTPDKTADGMRVIKQSFGLLFFTFILPNDCVVPGNRAHSPGQGEQGRIVTTSR
jgi:hypothetical protein